MKYIDTNTAIEGTYNEHALHPGYLAHDSIFICDIVVWCDYASNSTVKSPLKVVCGKVVKYELHLLIMYSLQI